MVCIPERLIPGNSAGDGHIMSPLEIMILGNAILIVSRAF